MNGYIPLPRRFFSHALWQEDRQFSRAEAFLDLLKLAAYAHTKRIVKGALVTLKPGELCGSERYLSGRWKWSTKKVRAFLTLLEADGLVEVQKKRRGSIIFLCGYGKGDAFDPAEEAPKTHRGSTEEAPRKQIEEGKEEKEGRTKRSPLDSLVLPFESPEFMEVWEAWKKHRKEIRKPLTETSVKTQLAQFQSWGEARTIRAILHTIRKGWQGLKEPEPRDLLANPPTFDEVSAYAMSGGAPAECATWFFDRMSKFGWYDLAGPVVDWRAALRLTASGWERNEGRVR